MAQAKPVRTLTTFLVKQGIEETEILDCQPARKADQLPASNFDQGRDGD
jgi:hypothetical protein